MDVTMLILILGLAALGAAWQTWGADSRDPHQDNHNR